MERVQVPAKSLPVPFAITVVVRSSARDRTARDPFKVSFRWNSPGSVFDSPQLNSFLRWVILIVGSVLSPIWQSQPLQNRSTDRFRMLVFTGSIQDKIRSSVRRLRSRNGTSYSQRRLQLQKNTPRLGVDYVAQPRCVAPCCPVLDKSTVKTASEIPRKK